MDIEYINSRKPLDSLLTALRYNGAVHCQLKMVDALCKCGNIKSISASFVLRGKTKSCGCTRKINCRKEAKFTGHSKRIRGIWHLMKFRCYNKNANCYHTYGGKGIVMCDEWLNNYQSFLEWSLLNGYEPKLTIDRIDNNKSYTPDNCRWITHKANCNNRDTCIYITNGCETKTLQEWSELLNIHRDILKDKIFNKGIDIEQLLNS